MSDRFRTFGEGKGKGIDDLSVLSSADRRFIGQDDPNALKRTPAAPQRAEPWTAADTDALLAGNEAYAQANPQVAAPGQHAVETLVVEPDPDAPKRDREALRQAARRVTLFPRGRNK